MWHVTIMKRPKTLSKLSKEETKALESAAQKKLNETPMEKGDMLAFTIAALLTFMPVVLIVLAIFFLVMITFII
jgi:cell division septal protein FtsQ